MPGPERRPSIAGTIALLVIGLLIFIPSGLCTGIFAFEPITQIILHPSRSASLGDVSLVLMIGGPFVLLGGFLIGWGIRRLTRR
jgi:hypothetical protein